jgi:hypothetical protein
MSHWVKFARAHEHLTAIEQAIRQFDKMKPYSLTGDYKPPRPYNVGDEARFTLRVHAPAQPPAGLPELIGDYLTNLRASLDHIVFSIANKHTSGNFTNRLSVQFAIHQDGQRFGSFKGKVVNDLPSNVLADMERLQPYQGCDDPKFLARYVERQPLWILSLLVNEDKHRALVTVPSISLRTMKIELVDAVPVDSLDAWTTSGSFKHGAEVVSVRFRAETPNAKVKVDPDFTMDIAFTEEWPALGRPVIETLQMLSDHVRDVVFPIFEQHL